MSPFNFKETVQETHAREKACDFVEDCLAANWTFEQTMRALKAAWIEIHDERACNARKDVART